MKDFVKLWLAAIVLAFGITVPIQAQSKIVKVPGSGEIQTLHYAARIGDPSAAHSYLMRTSASPASSPFYQQPSGSGYPMGVIKGDEPTPQTGNGKDSNNGDEKNGNGSDSKNGDEKNGNGNGKREPEHTRDNGFLVEEAFNQEPGVVQHIFNWINLWDRQNGTRSRDFLFTYTMEIPLGTQKHQFSFTFPFLTSFEHPSDGPASQQGDVGDFFLNYRYQLLADDEFLWCAPRATLILPVGDDRFGSGTGEVGYQFNLPISHYGEDFDCHFNAGYTHIPNVSVALPVGLESPGHDLRFTNLGGSVFWKPNMKIHPFVELLAIWGEEINDDGNRENFTQAFVNPGFRYVVSQFEDAEWVMGVSVPIGLTSDTADIGVFVYMSVEHTFRKVDEEKCNKCE